MKKGVHIVLVVWSLSLLIYLNSNAFGASKKGYYIFTIGLSGYALYISYIFFCKVYNELLKNIYIQFLEEAKKITTNKEYYFIIEQITIETSCDFRMGKLVDVLEKIIQEHDFDNKKQILNLLDIDNEINIFLRLKNRITENYSKLSVVDILNKKASLLLIDCIFINEHIKIIKSKKGFIFSLLIIGQIALIMVFSQSTIMLYIDIIITIIIWVLFKKSFVNSFTYNIGYYFYIIINVGHTCIMPIYNIELFKTVNAVLLISIKIIICMIIAMWPLNYTCNLNIIENMGKVENLDEQLYLAVVFKLFKKLKIPFMWVTLVFIIFMNIFIYTVITYNYVGYGTIECIYNSFLNYFTGNTIIPSRELVGQLEIIMLSQNIVAFVINTMFIANLLECTFSK